MTLYIGLMSGTSMDGIDAVLLEIGDAGMQVRAAVARGWAPALQQQLRRAAESYETFGLIEFGRLDTQVGHEFALAATELLCVSQTPASAIRAIGSHGQTVLHRPRDTAPFTLQIGDPNIIAEQLRIDVVADFRRRDVAAGGEGAPLMPAFHLAAFGHPGEYNVVANIGGIANVSLLREDGSVIGFDTGPGNCLLDAWSRLRRGQAFDDGGAWAATGSVNPALLESLMADSYFLLSPPKSTGRDAFSDDWLHRALHGVLLPDADVQATLCELTARTIADAVLKEGRAPARLLVCGGGAANLTLMRQLARALSVTAVESTATAGIDPQHVEGAGFAWLAHRYLIGLPGNIPSVTGARRPVPLGALYPGG
jgi:anhydro-N-acetylmuramic acid kinase